MLLLLINDIKQSSVVGIVLFTEYTLIPDLDDISYSKSSFIVLSDDEK